MDKSGWNGQKWMKVVDNEWIWIKVDENGCKWMKIDESGWKWLNVDINKNNMDESGFK